MLAEPADQLSLLNLADLDQELGRLQHAARNLPEHKAISDLMATRMELADALTAAHTELDTDKSALSRAEADLVPVRARLERERKRLADGSVTDAKVLRGLTDEVEHIARRISDLEDVQLEAMEAVERSEATVAELAARKEELETRLRDRVTTRDDAVAKLSGEAKAVSTSRQALAAKIPTDLLKLYEKVRAHSGLGAAKLARGRCTGCQLEITLSDLDNYRKAPANQVLRCVECDRILVRTPESGL